MTLSILLPLFQCAPMALWDSFPLYVSIWSPVYFFLSLLSLHSCLASISICCSFLCRWFWLGFRMGAIPHLDKLIFKYLCRTNCTLNHIIIVWCVYVCAVCCYCCNSPQHRFLHAFSCRFSSSISLSATTKNTHTHTNEIQRETVGRWESVTRRHMYFAICVCWLFRSFFSKCTYAICFPF